MNTLTLKKTFVRWKVKETAAALAGSVILPYLVHLVPPVNGFPLGARLLPMFYAPFVAVVLFKPHVAIITGLFAPVLNSLLIGYPLPEKIAVLTLELILFVLIAYSLKRIKSSLWVAAPLAYLVSVFWVTFPFAPFSVFIKIIGNALPGIAVLTLLNIFLLRLKSEQ